MGYTRMHTYAPYTEKHSSGQNMNDLYWSFPAYRLERDAAYHSIRHAIFFFILHIRFVVILSMFQHHNACSLTHSRMLAELNAPQRRRMIYDIRETRLLYRFLFCILRFVFAHKSVYVNVSHTCCLFVLSGEQHSIRYSIHLDCGKSHRTFNNQFDVCLCTSSTWLSKKWQNSHI